MLLVLRVTTVTGSEDEQEIDNFSLISLLDFLALEFVFFFFFPLHVAWFSFSNQIFLL